MTGEFWAALVGGGFAVVVALIGVLDHRTRKSIGVPNGKGNVVQMLEKILAGQTGQDSRLASIEARQNRFEGRLGKIETHLGTIEDQMPNEEAS